MLKEKNDITEKSTETEIYAHKLALSDLLREQAIRSAVRALKLPPGSRGLDAGCGTGSNTLLLAEAVGSGGHVIGLDLSPGILVIAREIAEKSGLSEQVSFQEGDVNRLPFDDDAFDWVWSVDCVGYYRSGEPLALVKELARVVKPGGSIAILFWSSQQLLPGYPLLEARLNATSQGIAPFSKGKRPELHFLRALGWFHEAGLVKPGAKTFAGDVHAPLSDDIRSALISLFQMRWGEPQSELPQDDWEEYLRLCQPESPNFILNLADYHAFFTYSMFSGRVAP
jgi:demethylmenaquinone methyltransferase / 2-methoxy-6-polyprenyl-1,4-benzoquinol methylase